MHPPGAVYDLEASSGAAGEGSIVLLWHIAGDDSYEGYLEHGTTFTIQYSTFAEVEWSTAAAQITDTLPSDTWKYMDTTYTITGILASTTYY